MIVEEEGKRNRGRHLGKSENLFTGHIFVPIHIGTTEVDREENMPREENLDVYQGAPPLSFTLNHKKNF